MIIIVQQLLLKMKLKVNSDNNEDCRASIKQRRGERDNFYR